MSIQSKYEDNSTLKDAWLHGMVEAALLFNGRLNKYNFTIQVLNQQLTLSGEVNTTVDEWLCLTLTQGIQDIKNVISELTVVELELLPTEPATSRHAVWHWYNDLNTSAEVKTKLQWNSKLSGKEIGVSTEQGVVTLSGDVDYAANKALAELITSQVVQVKEVNNQLSVNS